MEQSGRVMNYLIVKVGNGYEYVMQTGLFSLALSDVEISCLSAGECSMHKFSVCGGAFTPLPLDIYLSHQISLVCDAVSHPLFPMLICDSSVIQRFDNAATTENNVSSLIMFVM